MLNHSTLARFLFVLAVFVFSACSQLGSIMDQEGANEEMDGAEGSNNTFLNDIDTATTNGSPDTVNEPSDSDSNVIRSWGNSYIFSASAGVSKGNDYELRAVLAPGMMASGGMSGGEYTFHSSTSFERAEDPEAESF